MKASRQAALLGVAALALAGGVITVAVVNPSPSCQPDPAAAIASTPAGGVWQGSGCYTTNGISVPSGVTVNGGTFNDPETAPPASGPVLPIFRVKDTAGVTIENVTLNGQNIGATGRAGDMVGEAGVQVLSSTNVNLDHIAVNHVFGDGLTLGFQPRQPPSSNVAVNGYAINGTGAIRPGVTVAYVNGATLDNVSIQNSSGFDFESDLAGVGSGNVTVNGFSGSGNAGVRLIEALSGPVVFNHFGFAGDVSVINAAAASSEPITFNQGTILLRRSYNGVPPAGLWVSGPGRLTFLGANIGRQAGTQPATGSAWLVSGGGTLTLTHCSVAPPLGPPAGVTINP